MILSGGENVYSTEVEAVLIAHPAVAQVAVFGIPNVLLGELVAAAVVLKPQRSEPLVARGIGGAPAGSVAVEGGSRAAQEVTRELTEWCRRRLAHYKVPSQVRDGVSAHWGAASCSGITFSCASWPIDHQH